MSDDILKAIDQFQFKRATPLDMSDYPQQEGANAAPEKLLRLCGLRFGDMGRVFDFTCDDLPLSLGAEVVAELPEKGPMLGTVVKPPMTINVADLRLHLRKVLRVATEADLRSFANNRQYEANTLAVAKRLVDAHQLEMYILRVESNLDRSKVIVYFASEKRVDFRNLLRELVREVQSRVELRQIGARDQAKEKGAIGPCGEETCCSRFLTKFAGVSIRMAREQGLSLTPTKISGNCGRLKCCLAYEHPIYQANLKTLPQKGKCVKCKSSGKCGVVRDVDVLKQEITVRLDDGSMAVLKAGDVIEESSTKRRDKFVNETVVATTDTELLKEQIETDGDQE